MSEEELFYLEEEDHFGHLNESDLQRFFSHELPRPFQEFEDEKSGKEGEEGSQVGGAAGGYKDYSASHPSLAQLTQHNFKNIIQQAYSNTLFYGRSRDGKK